jgi:hypothetical protein
MKRSQRLCTVLATLVSLVSFRVLPAGAAQTQPVPGAEQLRVMAARLAPVDVRADVSPLPANERQARARLVEAARRIDGLYLRQVAPLTVAQLTSLADDSSEIGRTRLHYFLLNKGPWSELDEDTPFLPGVGPRPPQANFYPPDATREEVETWLNTLPEAERTAATGFFTAIRRTAERKLTAVPYSIEYQNELIELAGLLNEAAQLTRQPSLRDFLQKRAASFLSNDYYESDLAWMALDATIEPTIGPYEVYADDWFNYKAAFEAFITLTDATETAKLARFGAQLQGLEDRLPIEPRFRKRKLGASAPIRVVNVVITAGDGNHGVQSAAYNLPNDERVVAAKGSKRIMLKNLQEAKFEKVLVPIAAAALAPADRSLVAFEPFFTHILMHELMHGLGPQTINVNGRDTTVRQELKELNGTLEEAKADVSGLWALQQLMDKGVIDRRQERAMYVTFLASTFRTLRFGLNEAHAKGMALQVNYLMDAGGVKVSPEGTFTVDVPRMKKGVTALTHDIMTIQAHGDYAGAKQLLERMVSIRPESQAVIDQLRDTPVDIAPHFVTAEELTGS